jgi:inner membrane transporter RhtA
MGTSCSRIVLIAPWTNNGINVLGVLFALLAGAFGLLYRPGRKGFKIMKDGGCCNWNALCFLLIVPFGIMEMDSVIIQHFFL